MWITPLENVRNGASYTVYVNLRTFFPLIFCVLPVKTFALQQRIFLLRCKKQHPVFFKTGCCFLTYYFSRFSSVAALKEVR